MTCEVAVMNSYGIALATDSAVTMEGSGKTYYTAEKLFQFIPDTPIGIMIYGSADLMGIPWEILIAEYQIFLGSMRYNTLLEYLENFIHFIENNNTLFSESAQKLSFFHIIRELWSTLYAQPWHEDISRHEGNEDNLDLLRHYILEDHPKWENYALLKTNDCRHPDHIIRTYKNDLKALAQNVFKTDHLPDDILESLYKTIKLFLTHAGFLGAHSGLVLAGMGSTEFLPQVFSCHVGPMVNNHLKFHIVEHAKINSECNAMIIPFAQRDIIDMLINGIHPDLHYDINRFHLPTSNKKQREWHDNASGLLKQKIKEEISESYAGPFMEAVSAMPRYDLAMMAESLINLTAFRVNANSHSKETVGGPIDVAIISKNSGFTWVKKKTPH